MAMRSLNLCVQQIGIGRFKGHSSSPKNWHQAGLNAPSAMNDVPFQLKTISMVIVTLLAQPAYLQQAYAEERLVPSAPTSRTTTGAQATTTPSIKTPPSILLAENTQNETPDVYEVLLGEAPRAVLPTTAQRYNVNQEIIRTAEANGATVSEPADPNNKINTPNKSLNGKSLNKKEGANLPLGTESKSPALRNVPSTPPGPANSAVNIELKEVKVRAKRFKDIGPMPGLALTKEQIPGNIQSISAKEIKEAHSLSLSDLLNSKLQSVNVNDYQGNPFQMDVTYRGFTASPQIGSPQGLSVFFDGIRVNEPFGDVVNWDLLPMNALSGFDLIPGSNPLFGLNTLGGALAMKTKSGFTDPGVSAEVLAGSFGRRQLQASGGWNNANQDKGSWDVGDFAAFGAVNLFLEDGWRDNSPSKVNQGFAKLEWQGERASLAFSTLGVVNKLVGNGTVPQELYREDPSAVFTSPDETRNKLLQFQISGAFDINDKVNITGMVYNRQSDRKSNTGDIIDYESFNNTESDFKPFATRRAAPGETINCAYLDSDKDGIPNYYVMDDANYIPWLISANTVQGTPGGYDYSLAELNGALPADIQSALSSRFKQSPVFSLLGSLPPIEAPSFVDGSAQLSQIGLTSVVNAGIQFNTVDINNNPVVKRLFFAAPANFKTCADSFSGLNLSSLLPAINNGQGTLLDLPARTRDGANDVDTLGNGAGVVAGTPTAIITKSDISQTSRGANLQLNFNLDQHKFMVGTAIEHSKSDYIAKQRLGTLDENRNVSNDPAKLGDEYFYATRDALINQFEGSSITKSLYASETWSPTQNLNFTFSGRYNHTKVKNTIAPRFQGLTLTNLKSFNRYLMNGAVVVPGDDLANSPIDLSKPLPPDSPYYDTTPLTILPGATEEFSFHRVNPAIGATWQARPNLNVYANWNQGTRAPSNVELGCAYDGTLVNTGTKENPAFFPRSIVEGRGCSLPSTLSGDPFLPQVVAQTIEGGARGKFGDFMEWNISAYRTDVRDDIYLTSLTPELSFFQSIGDTRRQGIEFGIAGEHGKSDFRINYSLTEATFQSGFKAISPNNSSRSYSGSDINMIQVKPGNVMPGVPFNNVNFNWGYKVTPKFKINTTVVAHSDSFLRGNENNAHTPSEGPIVIRNGVAFKLPDNKYSGKAPGYAVLNMNARYDLGNGWAASALVNNVLDKTYFSAGRLGINPVAPSTFGAIGPGGFNYNSNEWIPSQFISAGAPRGIWLSLSYDYDPTKKAVPPVSLRTEPNLADLEPPSPAPTAEELALNKQLDTIKALPVIKRTQLTTQQATQAVTNSVEAWRNALASKQAEAYLALYAPNFAPAGLNHAEWVEQTKLQLATDSASSVTVNDVVIAPEGKRMVAVFNQIVASGTQPNQTLPKQTLKVLTFELKDGQWQITREHSMPTNAKMAVPNATSNKVTTMDAPPKASQLAPPTKTKSQPVKTNNVALMEVK